MGFDLSRRTALKGAIGGAAILVGLPLLDAFLDSTGRKLAATGKPLPVRFGTWFWGLGVNAGRWFPERAGFGYDLKPELEPIAPYRHKINILGDFSLPLDGAPNLPHASGAVAIRTGRVLRQSRHLPGPSLDVTIGEAVGAQTRLRALHVAANGDQSNPLSGRGGKGHERAHTFAASLYTHIFGCGSNASGATARDAANSSVLSAVSEQRRSLERTVGVADRRKLDQYFTAIRDIERRIGSSACGTGTEAEGRPFNTDVDTLSANHRLMADLLVLALACDQTRVVNLTHSNAAACLTRNNGSVTHHRLTHEEVVDEELGCQPRATSFVSQIMKDWAYFVAAFDGMTEGDGTLLDNSLLFAHSDTGCPRLHTVDNIPMMTAGSAGGRLRTGIHVRGYGSPVSRVGLTLQRAMGVQVDSWGNQSLETGRAITEVLA